MTLLTEEIRQRIENIILGVYNISDGNYQIPFGLFELSNADLGTIEQTTENASDRKIEVLAGTASPIHSVNHSDGFGLYYSNFTVKVSYYYTHLGSDLEEVVLSASGNGHLKQINDRANEDYYNISKTITHIEAFSGVTPSVYKVDDPSLDMNIEGLKVIATLTFRIEFEASLSPTYSYSFIPSDISDLKAWFKSDAANFTYDGSNLISQWNDLSGNGKHAVQTIAGRKPTFVASGGIKNKAYMSTTYSAGAGKGLLAGTTGDWNFLHNGSEFTVIAVAQTSGTDWNWLLGTQTSGVTDVGFSISSTDSSGKRFSVSVGNGTIDAATIGPYGNSIDSTKPFKVIARFSNETFPKDALFVKVNDKSYSTSLIASPLNSSFGVLGIGAGGTGLYSADSRFYEVMVFNRRLTDQEVSNLELYINREYEL